MAGGGGLDSYNKTFGFVYVFNLIVGTGALALPYAFQNAGLILAVLFLALMAFIAYICVTFIIEAQAASNAIMRMQGEIPLASESHIPEETTSMLTVSDKSVNNTKYHALETYHVQEQEQVGEVNAGETSDVLNIFSIDERTEMGHMADLLLGPIGKWIFYVVLIIYLYGDLAIYAVVVPKSLLSVVGNISFGNNHLNANDSYYFLLGMFSIIVIPFCFFTFTKTKYLQLVTLLTRNVAFFMMIIIGFIYIGQGHGAPVSELKLFDITKVPDLYGVTVYSFMCHHSLPGIVTPISNKNKVNVMFGFDFVLIFIAYNMMCFSAVFAYGGPNSDNPINQLYTLNFANFAVKGIAIYLALFPVFTLTTSFPLIAITLRNNLQNMISSFDRFKKYDGRFWYRSVFALVAVLPPIGVAFGYSNIQGLVGFTGSFAGLGIQFIFPCLLALFARRKLTNKLGKDHVNPHKSPFSHTLWIIILLIWSAFSLGMNIFKLIWSAVHK